MSREIVRPIYNMLADLEKSFLTERGGWPGGDEVKDFVEAFARLKDVYILLDQEIGRRDLSFRRERALRSLREHCLWLVRRLSHEFLFRTELVLETELKARIPASIYDIYLRLVEVDSLEQEFDQLSDAQLVEQLLTGGLQRYITDGIPSRSA